MARTKKTTTTKSSKSAKKSNSTNKNSSVAKTENFVNQGKQAAKNSNFAAAFSDPGPVPMDELRSALPTKPSKPVEFELVVGTTRPIFYPFKAFMGEGMVYINLSQIRRIAKYTTSTKEVCQVCDGQTTQLVEATLIEVMAIIGANV